MSKRKAKPDKKLQAEMLRQMLLIRRFEETSAKMYGLRKIGGFCHLYIGQEAVAVGAVAALDMKTDYVLTAYRDHGHAIAVGMEPKVLMAELYGKITGCARGKGGSMHFFDAEKHFFGGNGIVGAHVPLATGVGLKIRYNEEDGVVLCFFGDGAIHQGAFHEALNLAKIWELPVVYICENNRYGMGTDWRRVSSQEDFSKMAVAYDMAGAQIDGMDAMAVYEGVSEAVQRARKEHAPTLIEAQTYRYQGHSMSDPAKYRTKDELNEYKSYDPIEVLKKSMVEQDILSEKDLAKLDDEVKAVVKESVEFAENSEQPALETLYEDVLA